MTIPWRWVHIALVGCAFRAAPGAFGMVLLRGASDLSSLRLHNSSTPTVTDVCSTCDGASNVALSQDCSELQTYCSCCTTLLQNEVLRICSSFYRSGNCVEDIKLAIQDKKVDCARQQAEQKAARQRQYDEIEAQYGDIFPNFVLGGETAELGPFDDRCLDTCSNSTLCTSSGGCNMQLWQDSHEYNLIVGWSEMHGKIPCFHG
mmetsp:Transcript_19703/g.35668  ORF Transcript_19703/g.35668 Transcript_19703/m.35668 type:complete len:204 (-) Transcript_19703:72-683(-)